MNVLDKTLLFSSLVVIAACGGDNSDGSSHSRVYIEKGAVQCESAGRSLDETAQLLIGKGIDVIESDCGTQTHKAVLTVCGAEDVSINLHTIPSQSLVDAKALGFDSVDALTFDGAPGYVVTDCVED